MTFKLQIKAYNKKRLTALINLLSALLTLITAIFN